MRGWLLAAVAASAVVAGPASAISVATGIQDGGFEGQGSVALSAPGSVDYCYFQESSGAPRLCGNEGAPWSGASGLISAGSAAWGGTPSQDGSSYYSFVQGGGSLSQTFSAGASGDFVLNWYDHSRTGGNGGPSDYSVSIEPVILTTPAVTLLAVTPPATIGSYTSNDVWTLRFSDPFSLVSGQRYTLTFKGLNAIDRTAFIDNVGLATAVPEPATWAMMIGGFGLVGGAMRRRARSVGVATA